MTLNLRTCAGCVFDFVIEQVQQHPGLRERNLGILQGLTYAEGPAVQPEAWAALQSSSDSTRIPGGGESLDDLQQRMTAALLDIAGQYPGGHACLRCSSSNETEGEAMLLR
jgi:broad specificity phosphatase PhoE